MNFKDIQLSKKKNNNKRKKKNKKNPHYTMWEIANILKISKSIVMGENEICVFYSKKNKWTFWPTQY